MRRTRLVSFTLMLLLCMIAMSPVGAQVVNNRRIEISSATLRVALSHLGQ